MDGPDAAALALWRARRALREGLPRASALAVVALLLLCVAAPAMAATTGGALEVPAPTDHGAVDAMRRVQANETATLGETAVVDAAALALAGVVGLDAARTPATGDYQLRADVPPPAPYPTVLEGVSQSPYSNLTNLLDLLFDQPLLVMVKVTSGPHVNWVSVRLMPNLLSDIAWANVNIDNDTGTGDAAGNDVRLRLAPVRDRWNWTGSIIPPRFAVQFRGSGLAVELERLDPGSGVLPINTTFMKWFRYNEINYTWFLEYGLDRLPGRAVLKITTDKVEVGASPGELLQRLLDLITNSSVGNGTQLTDLSGPYRMSSTVDEPVTSLYASLGYLRILTPAPDEEAKLDSASWLSVRIRPSLLYSNLPDSFMIWLDSPAFNRSFDHLNWTADLPSRLEFEYVDDRGDNYTQARGAIADMPRSLRLKIDNVTESVGGVSKVHYTTSEPIGSISFDEWEFFEKGRRDAFLHSHVELADLPNELWLNGTLDIGGQAYAALEPDRTVRNVVPQLLDTLMVRISSKLFTVGRTLRSLPQNILNMPERKGYTTLEMPGTNSRLGRLEFSLTSGHHVTVDPSSDFLAFYNESFSNLTGKMVQTAFSGRLLDLKAFHSSFAGAKHLELESMYNRELRALFIDPWADANASLFFSNVPHNVSVDLAEDMFTYHADGGVDRVVYTSAIRGEYIRLLVESLPGDLVVYRGEDAAGISAAPGSIGSVELQIADRGVRTMAGDHLLVEMAEDGTAAASLRISDLGEARTSRETNHVSLRTGGAPFGVLIDDRAERMFVRARLDPLPTSVESDVTDVLGLGGLELPSLSDMTSVLEFATIVERISELGDDVLRTVSDISTSMVAGLGTFSEDLALNYTAVGGLDLVAEARHEGAADVPSAQWAHGVVVHMVPSGDEVLLDAKVYLTGLPPEASVSVGTVGDATKLSLRLEGYAPEHDHVLLELDGPSRTSGGAARDVWLYLEGLTSPMDLTVRLDLSTDMAIGGRMSGSIDLASSAPLGAVHARMRSREPQLSTVEVLLPRLPGSIELDFAYEGGVDLSAQLSAPLELVLVRLSRDLDGALAHSASIILHDVPRAMTLSVQPPGTFDMDADTPVANLPRVALDASSDGLDVLADIGGRAIGSKVDVHLDARDARGLTMTPSGDEWRVAAASLSFAHLRIDRLPYSEDLVLDRVDLAAKDLRSLTLRAHMVFGVYPIIDMDDVRARGLQLAFEGSLSLGGGRSHEARVMLLELPLDLADAPRSHTNGIALGSVDGAHRLLVPAPVGTLLGTVMG